MEPPTRFELVFPAWGASDLNQLVDDGMASTHRILTCIIVCRKRATTSDAHCSLLLFGFPRWIRTTISRFKGLRPTISRQGNRTSLAAPVGIEPTSHDSESHILPLDEEAIVWRPRKESNPLQPDSKSSAYPIHQASVLLLKCTLGWTTRIELALKASQAPLLPLQHAHHEVHFGLTKLVPSSGVEPLSWRS